ncbi:ATP-binding protein [Steroidobacter sp. S1-65]|uniref:histidine kinase n=1 Tax=Steroidobacter gossypii TaxID=2805490 RepID=A0ABS1WU63_9GAMM|nr:histidine kinase dimerization/phosphoacceptor domain -containing protein [Steroidobacter gossypii]MBM0104516.1 ATP-binding protein [Steroidobacter gossypii]
MKSAKIVAASRSWFGRNAGLRPRLVLIVGVAMLAPGALAVLQAISSYNSSMRILEQNLAQAAQLSATEQVNMISASRDILTSLAAQPDVRAGQGPACRRALQRAIGGLDQYAGASVVDAKGNFTCASSPTRSGVNVADRQWFISVMSGDGFVISDLIVSRWLGTWGISTAVPLVDDDGVIRGAVALFIGLDWLTRRYHSSNQTDDTAFALLDSQGEIITGEAERSPARSPLPRRDIVNEHLREHLQGGQTQTFRARGHDGVWRLYAISPLLGGRIFVILGTPVLTAIGPLALQVAWGVFTPLLMWALAIAVVWFGIEHLVVRWITYLERITSAYAAGRHSVRPERVSAAPAEIRSLGETFSRMADLLSARENELRDSLAQKEILVREIHHRVKNNLQLVMSLLNLHARRIRDPRAEVAFAEARSRINALATLHRRLYESESLQEIDLRWFLDDLCAELRRGGLSRGRNVELNVEAPSEVIGPDVAVPLGLLVTEAITNAYKHAFNERDGGHISVRVTRESPASLLLTIRDDGTGFDMAASTQDQSGLGRSLIEAFVRQLRGELETRSDDGTVVQVRFPAPVKTAEKKHAGHHGVHHHATGHGATGMAPAGAPTAEPSPAPERTKSA